MHIRMISSVLRSSISPVSPSIKAGGGGRGPTMKIIDTARDNEYPINLRPMIEH